MVIAFIIIVGTFLSLFLLGRKKKNSKLSYVLPIAWAIKCFAAGVFFYVYSEVYGQGKLSQDAGAYIQEAKILNTIYHDDQNAYYNIIFNRFDFEKTIYTYYKEVQYSRIGPKTEYVNETRNQIKFISLITLVIGEDLFAIFAFFALLSFLGLLVLWHALESRTRFSSIFILAMLILPLSLLFWTSNPLKESTAIFGLELLVAFWLIKDKSLFWYSIGIVGFVFALSFKSHFLILTVPVVLSVYFYRKIILEKKLSYTLSLGFLFALSIFFDLPKRAVNALSDKQFDFINVARGGTHLYGDTCFYFVDKELSNQLVIHQTTVQLNRPITALANKEGKIRQETEVLLNPGAERLQLAYKQEGGASYFEIKSINRSWKNLFLSMPQAFVNGFFRPFPWTNFISIPNLLLFIESLFYAFLVYRTLQHVGSNREFIRTTVGVLLLTSLIFTLIIGYTTPISGAIVRYRIPVQLFIVISYLITHSKYESNEK